MNVTCVSPIVGVMCSKKQESRRHVAELNDEGR